MKKSSCKALNFIKQARKTCYNRSSSPLQVNLSKMSRKSGVVYCIWCIVTNKIYVGKTILHPIARLVQHFSSARRLENGTQEFQLDDCLLHRDIAKYGYKNFGVITLQAAADNDYAFRGLCFAPDSRITPNGPVTLATRKAARKQLGAMLRPMEQQWINRLKSSVWLGHGYNQEWGFSRKSRQPHAARRNSRRIAYAVANNLPLPSTRPTPMANGCYAAHRAYASRVYLRRLRHLETLIYKHTHTIDPALDYATTLSDKHLLRTLHSLQYTHKFAFTPCHYTDMHTILQSESLVRNLTALPHPNAAIANAVPPIIISFTCKRMTRTMIAKIIEACALELPPSIPSTHRKPQVYFRYSKPLACEIINTASPALNPDTTPCLCTTDVSLTPYFEAHDANDNVIPHVMTCNLNLITHHNIRAKIAKGAKFRNPVSTNPITT
jgi:hypothetical protein